MSSSTAPSTSGQPTPSTPAGADVSPSHTCFICLSTDLDTPNETFVNPCPCTLEAHESCLLRWVAESEANRGQASSKPPKCPACNHRIRVDEPPDAVVALRNGIYRSFTRASPYVLLGLVFGGGAVGSAWYGLMSAHLFAGPMATARWLGIDTLATRRPSVAIWRYAPMWTFTAKIWALSLVGPGLMIGRAIPELWNLLLIPSSLLSAAVLVALDDMPTWPPTPAWAVTLFPFISLTYRNIYWEFFSGFERRLNRALRARPPPEEEHGAAAGREGQGNGEQGENEEQVQGVWADMRGFGEFVVDVFRNNDVGEFAVEVEVIHHDHEEGQEGDVELQAPVGEEQFDEVDVQAMAQEFQDVMDELGAQQGQDAAQQDPFEPAQVDVAEAAPAPVVQQHQGEAAAPQDNEPQQAQNGGIDEPAAVADNNRIAGGSLSDVVSSMALSLMYPTICFAMGELLYAGLPRSWVTRPAPAWGSRPQTTGLLQRRWGRSLVGGCLYVVLKDAFQLYAKYRQVQQKSKRKVRNVARRRGASS